MSDEKDDHHVDGLDDDKATPRPKTVTEQRLEWLGDNSKHITRIGVVVATAGWLVIHYLFPNWEYLVPLAIALPGILIASVDMWNSSSTQSFRILSMPFTALVFQIIFVVSLYRYFANGGDFLQIRFSNSDPAINRLGLLQLLWGFNTFGYLVLSIWAGCYRPILLEKLIRTTQKNTDGREEARFFKAAIHILDLYRQVRALECATNPQLKLPDRLDVDKLKQEVRRLFGSVSPSDPEFLQHATAFLELAVPKRETASPPK